MRTELLGLPSLGGFKGENEKESVGLTLPEGTVFESVDSKQEVACVRDHLSHSCENSQEGLFFFFFPLNVCGVRETGQWKTDLSPKEQRCQGSHHGDYSKLD